MGGWTAGPEEEGQDVRGARPWAVEPLYQAGCSCAADTPRHDFRVCSAVTGTHHVLHTSTAYVTETASEVARSPPGWPCGGPGMAGRQTRAREVSLWETSACPWRLCPGPQPPHGHEREGECLPLGQVTQTRPPTESSRTRGMTHGGTLSPTPPLGHVRPAQEAGEKGLFSPKARRVVLAKARCRVLSRPCYSA